jgi:DNA-binding FadR family transcriptional regulator
LTAFAVDGRPRAVLDPLAEQILGLIRERGLRVGDAVPTEIELIEQLSVSRNSVREAMRALRTLGIVEVRHGHGTYVADVPLPALSPSLAFRALVEPDEDRLKGLRNLVDVRELVEVGVVDRLVGRVPAEALDALEELCDQMASTHLDPRLDREFHRTLFGCLDNPLIGQLADLFWDAYLAARAGMDLEPPQAATGRTVALHRGIVAALRAGDAAAARDATVEHFTEIKQRLAAVA